MLRETLRLERDVAASQKRGPIKMRTNNYQHVLIEICACVGSACDIAEVVNIHSVRKRKRVHVHITPSRWCSTSSLYGVCLTASERTKEKYRLKLCRVAREPSHRKLRHHQPVRKSFRAAGAENCNQLHPDPLFINSHRPRVWHIIIIICARARPPAGTHP